MAPLPGDEVVQRYGGVDEGRLQGAKLPSFGTAGRELVSATIGKGLQRQRIYATLGSLAAITGYIAIRFRPSFALGGIAATFHDAFVTLACLSWAGYDVSLNVTAALLTVIGYSVNDTIVIFDRVRENALALGREPLAEVINRSVNQPCRGR